MIETIIPKNNLYLKYINNSVGWGVFTNCDIKKGDIVELCYYLPEKYSKSQHKNYAFLKNEFEDDAYNVLGFGMIYNHSFDSNIEWKVVDYNRNIICFSAIKDILSDEELCHNYGERYWLTRPKKEMTIL